MIWFLIRFLIDFGAILVRFLEVFWDKIALGRGLWYEVRFGSDFTRNREGFRTFFYRKMLNFHCVLECVLHIDIFSMFCCSFLFLFRFCSDLGLCLGRFLLFKIKKWLINWCRFLVRFFIRFLLDLGSILEALGGHLGGLGSRFRDALGAVSPSSLPRGSQERFGTVLAPFWCHSGSILETFLRHFWWHFGEICKPQLKFQPQSWN